MEHPIVTIEMQDGGRIVCELYPETAPQSVRNFLSLASKGFYDGLIFHRVISGFMIQGCLLYTSSLSSGRHSARPSRMCN